MKNTSKFKPTVSHDYPDAMGPQTYEDWAAGQTGSGATGGGNSGKFDTGSLITTIGSNINSLLDLFKKPDTYNTYNITQGDDSKKDNTMLYVGIGGVILVVILFIVIAIKK